MDKNQASPIGPGISYSGPYGPGGVVGPSTLRETQISSESNLLAQAVEENALLSLQIAERFGSILRAEPKLADPSAKIERPPEEYLVPLADSIRARRKTICTTNSVLEGILERAEI